MHILRPKAAIIYTDSKSAYWISHNPVLENSKHIQIDVHCTREKIQEEVIKLIQPPTTENLVDALTKPFGPRPK